MTKLLSMLSAAAFLIPVLVATSGDAQADERYGKQKVVYHINYEGGAEDRKIGRAHV